MLNPRTILYRHSTPNQRYEGFPYGIPWECKKPKTKNRELLTINYNMSQRK